MKNLRDLGKTLLVTTHDLLHVPSFANAVLFFAAGRLVRRINGAEVRDTNLEDEYLRLVA